MASKIQSRDFYLAITPYKLEGHQNEFNELQGLISYDDRGHAFDVILHAGWGNGSWHGCELYGGQGWLTDAQWIYVKEAPRNSQKTIDQMYQNLTAPGRESNIRELFDRRDWDTLKAYIKEVALTGTYSGTINSEQQNEQTTKQSTTKNETIMEAKNMTAQDYVGKTIIVGDNIANIVIKSADGNKLQGEFSRDNMPNMSMTIYMDKLQEYLANGTWKVKSDEKPTAASQEPTAKSQRPTANSQEPTTANPEPLTDNHEPEQDDPVIAQWKALKEKNADAMIIFRKDKVYVIVADDATKASQVAGLQVSQQGNVPICVFPTGDLSGIMCDLVKNNVRVVICDLVEEPTAKAAIKREESDARISSSECEQARNKVSTARQRVQPKFVKPETSEENPSSDPEEFEDEESTATDQEPRAKAAIKREESDARISSSECEQARNKVSTARQRVQPKTVRSEVTLEAEKGSAKIIDNGKSIIVAGDTQKIEAVLLTLWGRKRPYTRNGKMYSGIVLSAKHKATVKEIIKLAS